MSIVGERRWHVVPVVVSLRRFFLRRCTILIGTHLDQYHHSIIIVSLFNLLSLLSLYRMKHMAAYLMLVLGGNDTPTADDVSKALSSVGIESDSEQLDKLISELDGKDLSEILTSGEALLAKFGSGGGGGGGGGTFIFLLVLYINYVSLLLII